MKALTVKQPWAWAIAHGQKDVENRRWTTSYRGLLAIHAGAAWDEGGGWDRRVIQAVLHYGQPAGHFDPPLKVEGFTHSGDPIALLREPHRFVPGAVIAVADLIDVTRDDPSGWAEPDQFHWRLANVRRLDQPIPAKGALGLWTLPYEIEAAVHGQLAGDLTAAEMRRDVNRMVQP